MKELHEEIKDELDKIKKGKLRRKVLEEETHVEVDEIWHKRKFVVYFAVGRKTKLILNYHVEIEITEM